MEVGKIQTLSPCVQPKVIQLGVHNSINARVMKRFALTWRPDMSVLGVLESEEQPIWNQLVSFTLGMSRF